MFVASLVAVILSGSGLVAVMVFANGDDRPRNNGGSETGRETSTETGIDRCVLGTWRTVGHSETIPTVNVPVELTSGSADIVFNADGTGSTDYGDGMTLEGENITVELVGTVTFEYEAADGTFRYLSQDSDATLTLTVSGIPLSQDLTYSRRPAHYECGEDTLHFFQEEQSYEGEYRRV